MKLTYKQMVAPPGVYHDDEIQWDAHDRVGSGCSEMRGPSCAWWLAALLIPVAAALVAWWRW